MQRRDSATFVHRNKFSIFFRFLSDFFYGGGPVSGPKPTVRQVKAHGVLVRFESCSWRRGCRLVMKVKSRFVPLKRVEPRTRYGPTSYTVVPQLFLHPTPRTPAREVIRNRQPVGERPTRAIASAGARWWSRARAPSNRTDISAATTIRSYPSKKEFRHSSATEKTHSW